MRSLALLFLCTASAATAQPSGWLPLPTDEASVSLVASKPFLDGNQEAAYSSAWFLGTVQPVTGRVRIVGDLPFAFAGREFTGTDPLENEIFREDRSGAALGNLGIGVEVDTRPDLSLGIGVRIPTASDPGFTTEGAAQSLALSVGTLSETGRYGAFLTNTATVYGTATVTGTTSGPVSARAHLVPFALFPTVDGRDTEGYVSYAAQALYAAGTVRLGGGLAGTTRVSLRGIGEGFDERSEIAIGVLAEADLGRVRPALTVHGPVVGFFDERVDLAIGLGVTVSFD